MRWHDSAWSRNYPDGEVLRTLPFPLMKCERWGFYVSALQVCAPPSSLSDVRLWLRRVEADGLWCRNDGVRDTRGI